ETMVESPLFKADVAGTVTLAPILTNSTLNLPVGVSLDRSTASRLKLTTSDTNAAFVRLPDFYTLKGTAGEPKNDVNWKLLTGLVLQNVGKQVGGQGGSLLQGVAGALSDKSGTNASGTNASGNKASDLL